MRQVLEILIKCFLFPFLNSNGPLITYIFRDYFCQFIVFYAHSELKSYNYA